MNVSLWTMNGVYFDLDPLPSLDIRLRAGDLLIFHIQTRATNLSINASLGKLVTLHGCSSFEHLGEASINTIGYGFNVSCNVSKLVEAFILISKAPEAAITSTFGFQTGDVSVSKMFFVDAEESSRLVSIDPPLSRFFWGEQARAVGVRLPSYLLVGPYVLRVVTSDAAVTRHLTREDIMSRNTDDGEPRNYTVFSPKGRNVRFTSCQQEESLEIPTTGVSQAYAQLPMLQFLPLLEGTIAIGLFDRAFTLLSTVFRDYCLGYEVLPYSFYTLRLPYEADRRWRVLAPRLPRLVVVGSHVEHLPKPPTEGQLTMELPPGLFPIDVAIRWPGHDQVGFAYLHDVVLRNSTSSVATLLNLSWVETIGSVHWLQGWLAVQPSTSIAGGNIDNVSFCEIPQEFHEHCFHFAVQRQSIQASTRIILNGDTATFIVDCQPPHCQGLSNLSLAAEFIAGTSDVVAFEHPMPLLSSCGHQHLMNATNCSFSLSIHRPSYLTEVLVAEVKLWTASGFSSQHIVEFTPQTVPTDGPTIHSNAADYSSADEFVNEFEQDDFLPRASVHATADQTAPGEPIVEGEVSLLGFIAPLYVCAGWLIVLATLTTSMERPSKRPLPFLARRQVIEVRRPVISSTRLMASQHAWLSVLIPCHQQCFHVHAILLLVTVSTIQMSTAGLISVVGAVIPSPFVVGTCEVLSLIVRHALSRMFQDTDLDSSPRRIQASAIAMSLSGINCAVSALLALTWFPYEVDFYWKVVTTTIVLDALVFQVLFAAAIAVVTQKSNGSDSTRTVHPFFC